MQRFYQFATALCFLLFLGLPGGLACADAADATDPQPSPLPPDSAYANALEDLITEQSPAYLRERDHIHKAIQRLYKRRSYQPAWFYDTALRANAEDLISILRRANEEGLDPADYRLDAILQHIQDLADTPEPEAVAETDALLSFAFIDYASDLYNGRISPEDVDPEWYTETKQKDYAEILETALNQDNLAATLQDLAPVHKSYQHLRDALATYRTYAEQGDWPMIPEGEVLHPGDSSSSRVPPLRQRLATAGYLDNAGSDSRYNERLAGAVYRFQEEHGLVTDSLLGPSTAAALNISVEDRIRQIEFNMERWRWLPDDLGDRYVLVNVPGFRVYAYDDGAVAESMNVVVGKSYAGRQTPIFTDEMEHLIFSPYWNIPPSIANDEILPNARGNRNYLTSNNYQIVSHYGPGAEVYDPYTTSLSGVVSGELRLREKPGPSNALGLVKFMFPNPLAIYLHDTPADHLFNKTERDYSHGCIRVERPVDMAVYALAGKPAWDRARIEEAMHNGEWQQVDLEQHIPVYILYFTAFADDGGSVQFYDDIYGHDEALETALF
ncbi:MAG TPA: L,D-transpeptidase family protein [Rhodothermales bacterium]|nr:L,D-transpeptidase family protein [Rhodothermales bacterium]